jgi:hypothetical protein
MGIIQKSCDKKFILLDKDMTVKIDLSVKGIITTQRVYEQGTDESI